MVGDCQSFLRDRTTWNTATVSDAAENVYNDDVIIVHNEVGTVVAMWTSRISEDNHIRTANSTVGISTIWSLPATVASLNSTSVALHDVFVPVLGAVDGLPATAADA